MSGLAKEQGAPQPPLPRLRSDLRVDLVDEEGQAFPSVVVSDPIGARYVRLAWPDSGIFLAWQESDSLASLGATVRRSFGIMASESRIQEVIAFGSTHQLTQADEMKAWHRFSAMQQARKQGIFAALLHGYLFFRLPLLHPEPFLKNLLPRLAFVYARWFWLLMVVLGLAGVHLAMRQWPALVLATEAALQLQSIAVYAVALLALKGLHELGHALTTVKYGCRVPSMGIAVMLGAPVFYTDTTDSWRLGRRAERLAIVFAGVAAEMIVAVVAIVLWTLLPDGSMRSVCFAFATASIVLSLAVNLNPFMRFDGYFALSDYLRVPNLQARAFALGVWRLRELLFDLGHPPPEQVSRRLQWTLIHYAYLTALYRLFLFLGIAAMLYLMAGKAIGIVLGGFEIAVFIVLPVVREGMVWWSLRGEIVQRQRLRWTMWAVAAVLAVFLLPWISTVEVPTVLVAEREEAIYLPFAARLSAVGMAEGQSVRAGDVLVVADAADLERDRVRAVLEEKALAIRVARLHASSKEREERVVIESRLARSREKRASIDRRQAQLVVRAPFDGKLVDVDPGLARGLWLNEKQPLARLIVEGRSRARGMIPEADMPRVRAGAAAVFVPDDPAQPSQRLTLTSILPASDGRLAEPALADRHGGRVVTSGTRGELVARHGFVDVTFAEFGGMTSQVVRGMTRIEAERTSPAVLLWRVLVKVLVREQGF